LGGILSGVFTPTESAAVACVYAFFVTMFIYRDCKWSELPKLIARVVRTVGMVMIMIGFSIAFGYMMAIMQIPTKATEFFVTVSGGKVPFPVYVNGAAAAARPFQGSAADAVDLPAVVLAVVRGFGHGPGAFRIVIILNPGLGLAPPPVGPTMVIG